MHFFSERILFDVPLSPAEEDFIERMSDITAKDILVNKFIKKTNFIKEDTRVQLLKEIDSQPFSLGEPLFLYEKVEESSFNTQSNKAMILSSGGKESLLSYALLKDSDFVIYPAFFNESGRHWFTAIPAYKTLKNQDRNTIKVWSDIDRLYNFFLKNLPFVKNNYWHLNRDIYPIRLFTFEEYVFSFLPYALKEGIGNVLIGSEFDEPTDFTENANIEKGFKHYYGIYDQTAEFDQFMTSFFDSIGLPIKQWSIVRPLSGFMVERILGTKFPEIFTLQRSCHNVHIENGNIVPCGKCKKCLGVELYLLANSLDSSKIGYKETDIKKLFERLNSTHLNLDEKEYEHALFKATNGKNGKIHEEVEFLQFNPITSPISNFPKNTYGKKALNTLFKYVPIAYVNGKQYNKKQFMEEIWK